MREMRNAYKILFGITEGKRPHGMCRHRWEGNIKMDLNHSIRVGVNLSSSEQGLVVGFLSTVMNCQVP
jgi:hypothetical protein